MRKISHWCAVVALVGIGYILGATGGWAPHRVLAQNAGGGSEIQPSAVSDDTAKKIKAAFQALDEARDALQQESLYNSASPTMNVFGVLCGGIDAVADLESGRGVDPETFAALYAGQATEEVQQKLGKDAENRLTYNGKLIQMYPISRLKRLYTARMALAGEKPAEATEAAPEE